MDGQDYQESIRERRDVGASNTPAQLVARDKLNVWHVMMYPLLIRYLYHASIKVHSGE